MSAYTEQLHPIQRARERAGKSREQLGLAVGRAYPTVVAWERGSSRPARRVMFQIAEYLDCNIEDLEG